jgi:hypothetical protein
MPVVPFTSRPSAPVASPLPDPVYVAMSSSIVQQEAKVTLDQSHISEADKEMKLSPQERGLYERHLRNLNGPGGVDNPDGSRSTLYQTTVNIGGKETLIPRVWDGKILSVSDSVQRAKGEGVHNFPTYGSPEEAEARYQKMHSYMEKDTADYLKRRKR